ncbi:MAG TPA: SUMF1/EgtB/PvdO family nonheme iron enzyme [Planctomycetota bacterium]|nr:SUMF1/EgtB/PvdO family nonheme iron enzyme [Planctomycetota bacterium]
MKHPIQTTSQETISDENFAQYAQQTTQKKPIETITDETTQKESIETVTDENFAQYAQQTTQKEPQETVTDENFSQIKTITDENFSQHAQQNIQKEPLKTITDETFSQHAQQNIQKEPLKTITDETFSQSEQNLQDPIQLPPQNTMDETFAQKAKTLQNSSTNYILNLPCIEIGTIIKNQYQIVKVIAKGGMGIVYQGLDLINQRDIAIKMIYSSASSKSYEKLLLRFQKEASVCLRLNHRNVIHMYDLGVYQNQIPYIIMEYVKGKNILKYVEEHCPDNIMEQVLLIKKVAMGLDYVHKKQLLHRDIKPDNIIVRPNGEPVLIDFGIVKLKQDTSWDLTKEGELLGTLQYMPLEQTNMTKKRVDASSDIYSLGLVFYEILTKQEAYSGTIQEILYQMVNHYPPIPSSINSNIPRDLEQIVLKCIEKEQSKRYKKTSHLVRDLDNFLQGKSSKYEITKNYKRKFFFHKYKIHCLVVCFFLLVCSLSAFTYWRFSSKSTQEKTLVHTEVSSISNSDKQKKELEKAKKEMEEKRVIEEEQLKKEQREKEEEEERKQKLAKEGFISREPKTYTCGDFENTINEYYHTETEMEFCEILGGEFLMGPDNKHQVYKVYIKTFLMAKYECTQKQWKKIMKSEPWKNETFPIISWDEKNNQGKYRDFESGEIIICKDNEQNPAINISLKNCVEFCKKTGFSVPTEEQWEYACRGGSVYKYSFGNDTKELTKYAWYQENRREEIGEHILQFVIQPVGQKLPNAYGLYDMHGNVSEWCDNEHKQYNTIRKLSENEKEQLKYSKNPTDSQYVFRGGHVASSAEDCSSNKQGHRIAENVSYTRGVRFVFNIP